MMHYRHCAEIVHAMRERTRIRIAQRRDDQAFFTELSKRLSFCDGIATARANPRCASVTLTHRSDIHLAEVGMVIAALEAEMPRQRCVSRPATRRAAHATKTCTLGVSREEAQMMAVLVEVGLALTSGRPMARLLQWFAEQLIRSAVRSLIPQPARAAV